MSSEDQPEIPQWLLDLKKEALGSEEWAQLSKAVEGRVQDKLGKRGLQIWSQLSDAEKEIFVDEVEEDIRHEATYQRFYRRLGGSLDKTLLRLEDAEFRFSGAKTEVHPRGFDEQTEEKRRHPDIIKVLELAGEGAGALLRRWPDRLNELKVVGCRGLPAGLRREVWRLQLEHAEARIEYEKKLHEHRLGVMSKLDVEITKSCRQLVDAEFEHYDLSEHLMSIKSILSYIQSKYLGPVESPLQYIAVVLVWGINGAHQKPLSISLLIERMFALLEDVGYDKMFDLQALNILPGGLWPGLVTKVSEAIVTADRDFHTFLLTLSPSTSAEATVDTQQLRVSGFEHRLDNWQKAGQDTRAKQRRLRAEHGVVHRLPWNLVPGSDEEAAARGLLGLLIRPLVQRLFSGFFDELEGTCRVWDGLLLLGADWLAHFCAAFLLTVKPHILDLVLPNSPVHCLEWALNASNGVVTGLAFERTLEQHFMPQIRKDLRIRETREAMLAAALPTGDGARALLTPAETPPTLSQLSQPAGPRHFVETTATACQTESSVTAEREVERLLSPRQRHADPAQLQTPDTDVEHALKTPSSRPAQQQSVPKEEHALDTIELWYANRIYSLKIPPFDARTILLSGVADMVLNLPDNEDLLAAAIQHERKIPCTVARLQGTQLRLPKPSNVDVPLMMALVQKYIEIDNDYTRPMLRIDIAEQEHGQLAEFYLPPLAKGTVHATDVVEAAAKRVGLQLTHDQLLEYARQLEAYSKTPPREDLKRVDPRADPTKFRDPSYQSTEQIGFDLRIDLPLGQIAVAVRRADISFTVRQSDTEDLAKEVLRRTRVELAEVLRVPLETLEAVGIHGMAAHTMAEFNLSSPFSASRNRTVLQIFDELINLIANPYSELHQRTCLKKTLRAILRGKPHVQHIRPLRKAMTPPVHEAATGVHPSALLAEQREEQQREEEAAAGREEEEEEDGRMMMARGARGSTRSMAAFQVSGNAQMMTLDQTIEAESPGQQRDKDGSFFRPDSSENNVNVNVNVNGAPAKLAPAPPPKADGEGEGLSGEELVNKMRRAAKAKTLLSRMQQDANASKQGAEQPASPSTKHQQQQHQQHQPHPASTSEARSPGGVQAPDHASPSPKARASQSPGRQLASPQPAAGEAADGPASAAGGAWDAGLPESSMVEAGAGAEAKAAPATTTQRRLLPQVPQASFNANVQVKYFYTNGKTKEGPVFIQDLKALYAKGDVTGATYVWHKHLGKQWIKLSDEPTLAAMVIDE